jgi:hypothetical protein
MYTRSSFRGTLALFLFIVMLFHVKTSYGQFFVQSTSPAHGATSVDTIVTVSITFNSAIDTSVSFPNDFFY